MKNSNFYAPVATSPRRLIAVRTSLTWLTAIRPAGLIAAGSFLTSCIFLLVAARSITFAVDLRFGRSIYRWKALSIIYNFCEMSFFQIRKLSWSNLGLKLQCLRFQVHFSPCDFSFVPNFPILFPSFSLLFSFLLSFVKPFKSIKHH